MSAASPHMSTGTVLGGYRIDGVAGQGGMGVVYRATQLGLDRVVALKVIASEYAGNVDFRNRFKSEAQLAASIDHPNVVPIYETGEAEGVLYLAMRFVEGTDLRSLVEEEQSLGAERAVRIIWQVAGALDAAHRRGLVHRDVKPPNVLIAAEGEEHAYLTDFGLTKHAAASAGFTRTGVFVGTPDFAAPEQIRGEIADARADVYALGAVLFHALTGRTPFPRDSELAKMYAHLNDPAPAASPLAPGVPPALDVVIGTAMAKDPADRYESAGDLARAAWAALQGEVAPTPVGSVATGAAAIQEPRVPDTPAPRTPPPSSASAGTPAPRTPPPSGASAGTPAPPAQKPAGPAGWPRRRRIMLLVALPCLLVLALGTAALGAVGIFGGDENDDPRASTPTPTATATPTPTPDAPAQVTATIPVGDGPDGITADGRNVFVTHAKDGTLLRIDADKDSVVGDAVKVGNSPDQVTAGKGTLWVVDADGDQLQRLESDPVLQPTATIPIGDDAQGISLGPQLAWVANTGDDTVQRIDRAQAVAVGDPIGVGDHPIGIHVGSKVWVTNFKDGTLSKIDVASAQVEGEPLPTGEGARGVTEGFGAVWVSNLKDDTVVRIDPETFEVVETIKVGREPKEIVAALGSVWVVNSKSNSVTRIDPRTNRVVGSPIPVGQNPIGITATRGAIWVTNFADDSVSAIQP
jgi:YVTN family beta-propeller protein